MVIQGISFGLSSAWKRIGECKGFQSPHSLMVMRSLTVFWFVLIFPAADFKLGSPIESHE